MNEQEPGAPVGKDIASALNGANYLKIAQAALGIPSIMPAEVQAAVRGMERPDNLTWEGSPIWLTAYYAGLRQYVLARRAVAAEVIDPAERAACRRYAERIATRVSLANSVVLTPPESLPSAAWADAEGLPRANFQKRYGNVLRWAAVMPPRDCEALPCHSMPFMPDTIVAPAPTGVGKTLLGANYLAAAGIGQQDANGRRRRALWVTINQELMADLLDPKKTMQKSLPKGMTTSGIWQHSKSEAAADGDLVGITRQSLEDALTAIDEGREPLIDPCDFAVLMFDEAQDALSVRMTKLLSRFDCQKVMLTATPTRSNWVSLLNRYHHVLPMGRREAIEEGLLSPVHIISIMAETMVHAEHQAALAAIDFFIKHGKKATIYCQPGDDNAQARRIADLIQIYAAQMLGEVYKEGLVYAEMVGTANPNSLESIKAFEEQTHGGVRTTTQKLGVGWDHAELDGSIWVGPQGDLLALIQESGRSMRPKHDGRPAWWIQIYTPVPEGSQTMQYTLPQTVGLEAIPSPYIQIGATPSPAPRSKQPHQGPERNPNATGRNQNSRAATASADVILGGISPQLVEKLIKPNTPLAEVIIEPGSRERYIPPLEYSVTDTELAERFNVPLDYIHYHFEPRPGAQNVTYKSLRSLRLPGQERQVRSYVRHYHADEVAARLKTHPMPQVSDSIYSVGTMGNILHMPHGAITDAIAALGLPDRPPTRAATTVGHQGTRSVKRYTIAELNLINEYFGSTPIAEPGDVPLYALAEQYPFGVKILNPADRHTRRHPPTSDRKGSDFFVLAETVKEIAQEDARRRTLVPLVEIERRTGVIASTLRRNMTAVQLAFSEDPRNQFAIPGSRNKAAHVTPRMANYLMERLSPQPLRYNEITVDAIQAYITEGVAPTTIRNLIRPYQVGDVRRIGLWGSPVRVFDMQALQVAIEKFGRRDATAPPVDFAWFTAESADPSDDLIRYARQFQTESLGIDPITLAPDRLKQYDAEPAKPVQPAKHAKPPAPTVGQPPAAAVDAVIKDTPAQAAPEAPVVPETPAQPEWMPGGGVLKILNCTPAALVRLDTLSKWQGERTRKVGDSPTEFHRDYVAALVNDIKKEARSFDAIGWTPHDVLARHLELTPQQALQYIRKKMWQLNQEVTQVRLYRNSQRRGIVEVVYAQSLCNQLIKYRQAEIAQHNRGMASHERRPPRPL